MDLFSRNCRSGNFAECFDEEASTSVILEPINTSLTPISKTEVVTMTLEGSGSDVEVDEAEVEEEVNKSSGSLSNSESESGSASLSTSAYTSSSDSSSSTISSDSSNIDSSDCDAPVTSVAATATDVPVPKKPLHGNRQYRHQDTRRRHRQVRSSEQPFKPEQDGDKQKAVASELWASVPITLRRSGWGCLKATEMILNNFFYLTIRFANEPNEAGVLSDLWVLTIRYRPSNLRFILRYLIVAASLAPATLCSHVRSL